jgi:hypothetical protein
MSVAKGLLTGILGLLVASQASAQQWEQVVEDGFANQSWSEVVCQQGSGFQLCEKPEPVKECATYTKGVNSFAIHGYKRGGAACGETRIHWGGQLVYSGIKYPGVTNTNNSINTYKSEGIVVDGYLYEITNQYKGFGYGSCSGDVYVNNSVYPVCRTPVE